jgi:hypothetical protein
VDNLWLLKLYEDVGLTHAQAERAAEETRQRLLRRERPRRISNPNRSLTEYLVRDPLISLNRIIGRGDEGLPFWDEDAGKLSLLAFSSLLSETELDPAVSLAFAKVVVEAWEPQDLYGPIWKELDQEGPLDLDKLRKLDWTPLRSDVPPPSIEIRDTVVAVIEPPPDTVVSPVADPGEDTVVARRAPQQKPTQKKPTTKK